MKAVLFDFNGTLFDDTRFHMRAWQKYMRKKFGIPLTLDEVRQKFIGPNNATIFHSFFGDRFSEAVRPADGAGGALCSRHGL